MRQRTRQWGDASDTYDGDGTPRNSSLLSTYAFSLLGSATYDGWASLNSHQTYGTLVDEGDEGGEDDPSNPERSTNLSSSNAGSSDWISDNGLSSIGTSLLATADTPVDGRVTVTPEGAATAGWGSKLTFVPVGDSINVKEGSDV